VLVAPNGVSAAAFDVARSANPVPTVVFIGHLGWQPNIEAAHWLVQEVWPIVKTECPDAKLHLIGRLPARSLAGYDGRKGVSIHADVPSTLKYLSEATVATAPLLAAGGTRLKILEAMATGTPVVSTSRGALGLEQLQHPDALVVADSAVEFAHAITLFISSAPHPDVVRRQVEGYRWRHVLKSLVDVVDGQCREATDSHDRIPMTVASDGRETLQCRTQSRRTQSPARS